ncbi:MAG: hypothetical protein AAGD32_04185 [Planctomycetota bacterium]
MPEALEYAHGKTARRRWKPALLVGLLVLVSVGAWQADRLLGYLSDLQRAHHRRAADRAFEALIAGDTVGGDEPVYRDIEPPGSLPDQYPRFAADAPTLDARYDVRPGPTALAAVNGHIALANEPHLKAKRLLDAFPRYDPLPDEAVALVMPIVDGADEGTLLITIEPYRITVATGPTRDVAGAIDPMVRWKASLPINRGPNDKLTFFPAVVKASEIELPFEINGEPGVLAIIPPESTPIDDYRWPDTIRDGRVDWRATHGQIGPTRVWHLAPPDMTVVDFPGIWQTTHVDGDVRHITTEPGGDFLIWFDDRCLRFNPDTGKAVDWLAIGGVRKKLSPGLWPLYEDWERDSENRGQIRNTKTGAIVDRINGSRLIHFHEGFIESDRDTNTPRYLNANGIHPLPADDVPDYFDFIWPHYLWNDQTNRLLNLDRAISDPANTQWEPFTITDDVATYDSASYLALIDSIGLIGVSSDTLTISPVAAQSEPRKFYTTGIHFRRIKSVFGQRVVLDGHTGRDRFMVVDFGTEPPTLHRLPKTPHSWSATISGDGRYLITHGSEDGRLDWIELP